MGGVSSVVGSKRDHTNAVVTIHDVPLHLQNEPGGVRTAD